MFNMKMIQYNFTFQIIKYIKVHAFVGAKVDHLKFSFNNLGLIGERLNPRKLHSKFFGQIKQHLSNNELYR